MVVEGRPARTTRTAPGARRSSSCETLPIDHRWTRVNSRDPTTMKEDGSSPAADARTLAGSPNTIFQITSIPRTARALAISFSGSRVSFADGAGEDRDWA